MAEKPEPGASATEIQRYMTEHFEESLMDGMTEALADDAESEE